MGKKDLQAFYNTKKQNIVKKEQINWDKDRDEWLQLLNQLYCQIEGWLNDFENNDVISFEYKNIEINEEYIGIIKVADEFQKEETQKIQWVWKIATPPPAIKYIELDNDSFSDALLDVAGGE